MHIITSIRFFFKKLYSHLLFTIVIISVLPYSVRPEYLFIRNRKKEAKAYYIVIQQAIPKHHIIVFHILLQILQV